MEGGGGGWVVEWWRGEIGTEQEFIVIKYILNYPVLPWQPNY